MGRGGRIVVDRKKKPEYGIVNYIETDADYYPRIHGLLDYHNTSTTSQSDPDVLLQKLEKLIEKKRKLDGNVVFHNLVTTI